MNAFNETREKKQELLTVQEVSEFLKISRSSVYRLVENRLIPFYKIKSGLRFCRKDLEEYLESCRIEAIT